MTPSTPGQLGNFPMRAGALAFQGHSLIRRICLGKHVGPALADFCRSIVAGCTSSTSIARAQMNAIIAETFATKGYYHTLQEAWYRHVDDVSVLLVGSRGELKQALQNILPGFFQAVWNRRLTISSKSASVSSDGAVDKFVRALFAQCNVPLKKSDEPEPDIGAERGLGRATTIMNQRCRKAKKSAKKVLVFLKYSSVASNLFKTSSYQMLKYSYRNFGFAPSKLIEIDYMGGRCIKKYGFQPCHLFS